jgi:hypothetical protein
MQAASCKLSNRASLVRAYHGRWEVDTLIGGQRSTPSKTNEAWLLKAREAPLQRASANGRVVDRRSQAEAVAR